MHGKAAYLVCCLLSSQNTFACGMNFLNMDDFSVFVRTPAVICVVRTLISLLQLCDVHALYSDRAIESVCSARSIFLARPWPH